MYARQAMVLLPCYVVEDILQDTEQVEPDLKSSVSNGPFGSTDIKSTDAKCVSRPKTWFNSRRFVA